MFVFHDEAQVFCAMLAAWGGVWRSFTPAGLCRVEVSFHKNECRCLNG